MEKTSRAVITAIAEQEGMDPVELPPLYRTIDAENLDKLLASGESVVVRFEYEGYDIVVGGDTVELNGTEFSLDELT